MLLQNPAAADALEHRFCNFRSEFREGSTGTMVMTGTSFEITRAFEWFGDTYRHCGEYPTLRHFVVFSYEKKPVYLSMYESPTKDITVSLLVNPAAYETQNTASASSILAADKLQFQRSNPRIQNH